MRRRFAGFARRFASGVLSNAGHMSMIIVSGARAAAGNVRKNVARWRLEVNGVLKGMMRALVAASGGCYGAGN